jgi:hypothetical protein
MNIIDTINTIYNFNCNSKDILFIRAAHGYIKDNHIILTVPSDQTLHICHKLQSILSFNTVPVYHNKGKQKYYQLYIPDHDLAVNMQSILNALNYTFK